MGPSPRNVVESGPAQAVALFLDMVDRPEAFGDIVLGWVRAAERYDGAIVPPLIVAMDHAEWRRRLLAGWLLLYFDHLRKGVVGDAAALTRAEKLLVEALRRVDADELLWPCAMLTEFPGPPRAQAWLRQLLHHRDARVRCLAAAALTWFPDGHKGLLQHLRLGLKSDYQGFVVAAAAALARLGTDGVELLPVLIEALGTCEEVCQYHVLEAVKRLGPRALAACEPVEHFMDDGRASPGARAYAALTLGAITKGTGRATARLVKLLESDDPRVIEGAVNGLLDGDGVPAEAAPRLTVLLHHLDEGVRIAAVRGLGKAIEDPNRVVATLLERVPQEPSAEVAGVIALTIGSLGEPAVEALLAAARQKDMRTAAVLITALAAIGSPAVEHVAHLLGKEADPWMMQLLVGVVREAGSAAGPAVPSMARLLDQTESEELACYLTVSIFTTGAPAEQAASALARCVARRSEETAGWAERALWNLGPVVVPAIKEVLATQTGRGRERLALALSGLPSPDAALLAKYEPVPTDSLKVFEFIGRMLAQDDSLSLRGMTDQPDPDDARAGFYKYSTLQRHKNVVQAALGGEPLLNDKQGRRGQLTEWGRTVLREAQLVLHLRARR